MVLLSQTDAETVHQYIIGWLMGLNHSASQALSLGFNGVAACYCDEWPADPRENG